MAHPLTTVNLGLSVMGAKNLWWGGCAWDSFAISQPVKDKPRVLVGIQSDRTQVMPGWHHAKAGCGSYRQAVIVFRVLVAYWSPKVIARLNDYEVKVVELHREFVWH